MVLQVILVSASAPCDVLVADAALFPLELVGAVAQHWEAVEAVLVACFGCLRKSGG